MASSAKVNHDTSFDLVVIAVRVLDDVHITWFAAEVQSEHALRAWFKRAASHREGAYLAWRVAVDREEAAVRDLERLCELTQPYPERLARSQ